MKTTWLKKVISRHKGFIIITEQGVPVVLGNPTTFDSDFKTCKTCTRFTNKKATVILYHDGTIMSFGDKDCGGDVSSIRKDLSHCKVISIHSTNKSFCALTSEGKVYSWGDKDYGGSAESVRNLLNNCTVKEMISSDKGFCAVTTDEEPIVWGEFKPKDGFDTRFDVVISSTCFFI